MWECLVIGLPSPSFPILPFEENSRKDGEQEKELFSENDLCFRMSGPERPVLI